LGQKEQEKGLSNILELTELIFWFEAQLPNSLTFDTELEIKAGFQEFEFEKFELDWNVFHEVCVFRIGKFYYPFSIEILAEDSLYNKRIDRSNPSIKIIPDN